MTLATSEYVWGVRCKNKDELKHVDKRNQSVHFRKWKCCWIHGRLDKTLMIACSKVAMSSCGQCKNTAKKCFGLSLFSCHSDSIAVDSVYDKLNVLKIDALLNVKPCNSCNLFTIFIVRLLSKQYSSGLIHSLLLTRPSRPSQSVKSDTEALLQCENGFLMLPSWHTQTSDLANLPCWVCLILPKTTCSIISMVISNYLLRWLWIVASFHSSDPFWPFDDADQNKFSLRAILS